MTNRQARRETQRTARARRETRYRPGTSNRQPGGGGPPGGGGGGGIAGFLLRPYTLGVAALVLVLAGVIVYLAISDDGGGGGGGVVKALETARAELPLEMAQGNKLGADTAPVKIEAFEDFQCPFCLRYTANQEPGIVKEFVKAGKVQIIYRNFPGLGRESVLAGAAALCAADQNKFWEYHSALFLTQARAGQAENERVNVGRFSNDKLKEYGAALGLDTAAFNKCVDEAKYTQRVGDDETQGRSLGLRGTPSFLLNGRPLAGSGAPSLEDWRKIIDGEINKPAASPGASPGLVPVIVTPPAGLIPAPTPRP